jgi:hypothetical protein
MGKPHGQIILLMKINSERKTLAAFEAKQIKPSQQLEVKGGEGGGALPVIGTEDIVAN